MKRNGSPQPGSAAGGGLVARYLQRLATERGCSPRTVAGYGADLAILARLAARDAAEPDWSRLTEHDLRRWIASEARAGRSPRSTARRLSAWRGFYDWLSLQEQALANPARGVRAPRAPRRLPKALSPDQAASLMADPGAQRQGSSAAAARGG
ncbi:MAG: site-specific integrase, partial [Gammaproteobacteria bacterium]